MRFWQVIAALSVLSACGAPTGEITAVAEASIATCESNVTVYSQTSVAGSSPVVPGLFDQLGTLAGPGSTRSDFYEIFENSTGRDVVITSAVLLGRVHTPSTAVIVGLTTGPVGSYTILYPNPSDVRGTAVVPATSETTGADCFTSTSGFVGCPLAINFSPGVRLAAGEQLAFGFIAPVVSTYDAILYGTDMPIGATCDIVWTTRPYHSGFYFTASDGTFQAGACGKHYLVIEGVSAVVTIESVLELFDASVASGQLAGRGPGNSASGRLMALRNKIAAAAKLHSGGDTAEAVLQLREAYLRTDAAPRPPDFVQGQAAARLAAEIQAAICGIGI